MGIWGRIGSGLEDEGRIEVALEQDVWRNGGRLEDRSRISMKDANRTGTGNLEPVTNKPYKPKHRTEPCKPNRPFRFTNCEPNRENRTGGTEYEPGGVEARKKMIDVRNLINFENQLKIY